MFFCLNLFAGSVGFAIDYIIQKHTLDPAQMRIVTKLTSDLRRDQYVPVNKRQNQLLAGRFIHQIYVSIFKRKTIGLVFLNNPKKIDFPTQVKLQGSVIRHLQSRKTTIALWFHGMSDEEIERTVNIVRQQIHAKEAKASVWSHVFSTANAEVCDSRSKFQELNPVAERITKSSYSYCWEKVGEGASAAVNSAVEGIKEKAKMEFDMFSYWAQIQKVAVGLGDFAEGFFRDPNEWIRKNVAGLDSLDLSVLGEISREQMVGLACLTLGNEGVESLASLLISGPVAISIKMFQMISKLTIVSKLFALLKSLKSLTAENIAWFKDKIVALAESLITGKHTPEKADAMAGLMKLSPKLAEQGFQCLAK
ncbi:MAG: hypothetical protein JNM39_10210 [Bdellovibrionaceae bacterium]|nr:hypothetical protein [Pseudobdellovibrionaceae bacterium]